MNKYYILAIFLAVLVIGGIGYQYFFATKVKCFDWQIKDRVIEARTLKNQWTFTPDPLEVNRCERVTLRIFNEDKFDHGFAINAFGIDKRLPPETTTEITFLATQAGAFPFFCSVACGQGLVNGKTRGHFDHKGELIIR